MLLVCGIILVIPPVASGIFIHLRYSPMSLFRQFASNPLLTVTGSDGLGSEIICWALLLIDWAWMTSMIFGNVFVPATIGIPLLSITIVKRSVRYFSAGISAGCWVLRWLLYSQALSASRNVQWTMWAAETACTA